MKILCLHGAHSNGSNFKIQLLPFVEATSAHYPDLKFNWANGGFNSVPPPGYEDYFGAPPLHRHVDFDGATDVDDMLWKIRDMTMDRIPEQSIRTLIARQRPMRAELLHSALEKLFAMIDEDPEIDGILGYSEGAMVASSVLLEEARREREEGKPRRLKYAIFFGGWPPLQAVDGKAEFQMADKSKSIIDIPTFHVIGCNDPYIHGALSLYAMCNEDKATLFDHGKGHTVPRDAKTIGELATAIDCLWDSATPAQKEVCV